MVEENIQGANLPELSGKALKASIKINKGLSSYLELQKLSFKSFKQHV
jgi:hypothetical protein